MLIKKNIPVPLATRKRSNLPLADLEIGDMIEIEVQEGVKRTKLQTRLLNRATHYGRTCGKKFVTRTLYRDDKVFIGIWRTK